MHHRLDAALRPQLLSAACRTLVMMVPADGFSIQRYGFTVSGHAISLLRHEIAGCEVAHNVNVLVNSQFNESEIPWVLTNGIQGCAIGRDIAPDWSLEGGHTAFASAPMAVDEIVVEYRDRDGSPTIPVIGGKPYRFEGFFGLHRCRGVVRLSVLDEFDTILESVDQEIIPRPGGRSLDSYQRVAIDRELPHNANSVRLGLVLTRRTMRADREDRFYVFLANPAFGLWTGADPAWRISELEPEQLRGLRREYQLLTVQLPRFPNLPNSDDIEIEVFDRLACLPVQGSPLVLGSSADLKFQPHSFDGVTLTGTLSGQGQYDEIELLIDGRPTARFQVYDDSTGDLPLSLRLADEHLDGDAHLFEVLERHSGRTLYAFADVARSLQTPWNTLVEHGKPPFPFGLHGLARQRYENLTAHFEILSEESQTSPIVSTDLPQLSYCHEVLQSLPYRPIESKRLSFPTVETPNASVVIASEEITTELRRVLAALLFAYNQTSFEVIVVVPESAEFVEEIAAGVTVHRYRCEMDASVLNDAASMARGRVVVFLASRAEPSARWLDELMWGIDALAGVGASGGIIVDERCRVVNAGGWLDEQGRPSRFGSGKHVFSPEVNFVRGVDFVGPEVLAIRSDVFAQLGGFTPDLPLSLAVADICLRIRDERLRTVYVPSSRITLSVAQRAEDPLLAPELRTFKRRWFSTLRKHRSNVVRENGRVIYKPERAVLFIDAQVPRKDVDAGSWAAIQEIRLFQSLGFSVSFLPLNLFHLGAYTDELQRQGVEVFCGSQVSSLEEILSRTSSYYEIIYITRYNVARAVLPLIKRHHPRAKIIFNDADLHFLRELRAALASGDPSGVRRSHLTREAELEVTRNVDLTVSYTDVECAIIRSQNMEHGKVAKMPWVVNAVQKVRPHSKRKDISFVGSFGHKPNCEAVRFFSENVMPVLRRTLPDVRFLVYGSQVSNDIRRYECKDIRVAGHVPSLDEALASTRVFVAPLISGAGIKGKVLASMGAGLPTVLSPIAAEGIIGSAGSEYLLARKTEEWVDAIKRLYVDEELWASVSNKALAIVRSVYSFEYAQSALRDTLEDIDIYTVPTERLFVP